MRAEMGTLLMCRLNGPCSAALCGDQSGETRTSAYRPEVQPLRITTSAPFDAGRTADTGSNSRQYRSRKMNFAISTDPQVTQAVERGFHSHAVRLFGDRWTASEPSQPGALSSTQ